MRFFSKNTQKMVGIDFSASTVKLLELGKKGDTYCVESYAVEPLPPEAMNETDIKDVEAVGQAIANVVARSGTSLKFGAVAIQNSAVITKVIQMSADLKENELMTQIFSEADRYIPYPLEEVNLDFKVLGPHAKNPSLVDVLLVGTKTDNVNARVEALALGGLTAKVVDAEAYVLERAFEIIKQHLPEEVADKTVAMIDIGSTVMTLCVLHDGQSVYMRDQNFGGKQLIEEIQHHYNLSMEEAMVAHKEGKLPPTYETEILQPFRFVAVQQVSRALQFFFSSSSFSEISAVVLAGGTAALPGLAQLIQEQLGLPTIIANPCEKMQIGSRVNAQMVQETGSALLLCCGLAMRSFVNDN